jgi:hypothetical protein
MAKCAASRGMALKCHIEGSIGILIFSIFGLKMSVENSK